MASQLPPKGTGTGDLPKKTAPAPKRRPSIEDVLLGELADEVFDEDEPTLPAGIREVPRDGASDPRGIDPRTPDPRAHEPTGLESLDLDSLGSDGLGADSLGAPGPIDGIPPAKRPGPPTLDIEVVVPEVESHLTLELLGDGRLRAPSPETRDLLRDRLRKAEVLRTGPRWAVLRTLEVSADAGKKPPPENEVIAAGTLGERGISLIDFIGFVANGQLTGILTAASGEVERSCYFYRGDVVWASSNAPSDRFGEFLLQRGRITREQLAVATRDGDRRIGRACVERGFLPAHELYGLVQAQLTEIFDRMLSTETGMWFFTRASQETLAASQIHLSTQGLLVDALRRLDEMQIYRQRVRTPNVIVQRVKSPKVASGSGATTEDLLGQLDENLRPGASVLLKQLPGSATIAELMRILGKGEFEVTRTVYHLLRRGLVEIVHQPETGPIPRRVAAVSRTEAHDVISIYSMAFREMFEEVARLGRAMELQAAVTGFLNDESAAYAHLLGSASLAEDGSIDEAAMLGALQGMTMTSQELSDALSELLFFVLFQATEFLGRRRGDDLARRVKLILGMLAHTSAAGAAPGGKNGG